MENVVRILQKYDPNLIVVGSYSGRLHGVEVRVKDLDIVVTNLDVFSDDLPIDIFISKGLYNPGVRRASVTILGYHVDIFEGNLVPEEKVTTINEIRTITVRGLVDYYFELLSYSNNAYFQDLLVGKISQYENYI